MKYTHLFETVNEFTSAYNGSDYCEPWVSYIEENERVNYNKVPDPFNGHAYIDLGLPSGTLWATCNVGASSPEEDGDYFAWGEVESKSAYTEDNYVYGTYTDVSPDYGMTKYNTTDGKIVLEPEDDAAHVNMGGEWHMPTSAQCQELVDNTKDTWTNNWNGTGVRGMILTSTINGNSIFLPAQYYYVWQVVIRSATLDSNQTDQTFVLSGDIEGYDVNSGNIEYRWDGYPARGVITPAS